MTVVYVHPSANTARAADVIADHVHKLEMISPDAPNLVTGDLNSCDPSASLPTYRQYVTCTTRGNRKLDLCYGNIAGAYKSVKKTLSAYPITMPCI